MGEGEGGWGGGIRLVSMCTMVGEEGTVGGGLSKMTESSSLESMSTWSARESRKEDGE